MNKILEKHFVKKYPEIFRDMYGDMRETCMHWGIECADGWFLLLNTLCGHIQNYINTQNEYIKEYHPKDKKMIPQLIAHQIKEKFGTLTFYYEGGDSYCRGMVDFAEAISYHTCENCGLFNDDVGRTKGWIQSLCTNCAKEFNKNITYDKNLQALMAKVIKSRKNPKRSWQTIGELETDCLVKKGKK